jgi:hypothetical protein
MPENDHRFCRRCWNIQGCLLLLAIHVALMSSHAWAQPTLNWANGFIGGQSYVGGFEVDKWGNVITTGHFEGTIDFDPSPNVDSLACVGGLDVFVAKHDSNGALIWARPIHGRTYEEGMDVAFDSSGNVLITGNFRDTVDFDPGAGVFNMISPSGLSTTFLLKLDSGGNFMWAKAYCTGGDSQPYSIIVDERENVVLSGKHIGNVDFDPGPGLALASSNGYGAGHVLKLDASGNYIWASRIEASAGSHLIEVVPGPGGTLIAVGSFNGTCDLDPGPNTLNVTSQGQSDGMVVKLDSTGALLWANQMGAGLHDWYASVCLDSAGNIFCGLQFTGTVDFDPGPGISFLTSSVSWATGGITKLDGNGNHVWSVAVGLGSTQVSQICPDNMGGVYCSGMFMDSLDFDPGPGSQILNSNGHNDVFLSRYGSVGNFVWALGLGGTWADFVTSMSLGPTGKIHLAGTFWYTVDFAPGPAVYNLSSPYAFAGFIAQFSQCSEWATAQSASSCSGSYSWHGQTFNTTGTHHFTSQGPNGCDSIFTLNLTLGQNTSSVVDVSACGPYTWPINNVTYSQPGSYSAIIPNAAGCDSLITLILYFRSPSFASIALTTCQAYTWPITNLTYSASGTYTGTTLNAVGCDSVITLYLNIQPFNTSVTNVDPTLMANLPGAVYQWIDCNTNQPVPGATGQAHTFTSNGSYAVAITHAGCTDTSACYTVLGVGIDAATGFEVNIYPNPSEGEVMIAASAFPDVLTVELWTLAGQRIHQYVLVQSQRLKFDVAAGSYLLFTAWDGRPRQVMHLVVH